MEELRIIVVALEKARAKLKEEIRLAIREAFDNALAQVRLLNPKVDLLYTLFNYIMKDGAWSFSMLRSNIGTLFLF